MTAARRIARRPLKDTRVSGASMLIEKASLNPKNGQDTQPVSDSRFSQGRARHMRHTRDGFKASGSIGFIKLAPKSIKN